jgi:hypothetical protein
VTAVYPWSEALPETILLNFSLAAVGSFVTDHSLSLARSTEFAVSFVYQITSPHCFGGSTLVPVSRPLNESASLSNILTLDHSTPAGKGSVVSRTGLWIGLGVGLGVLVILVICVVVFVVLRIAAAKKKEDEKSEEAMDPTTLFLRQTTREEAEKMALANYENPLNETELSGVDTVLSESDCLDNEAE